MATDDESYNMLDDQSLCMKQEDIDSDDYSVYSEDDRKLPAEVNQTPSSIAIKQESDTEAVDTVRFTYKPEETTTPDTMSLTQEELTCGVAIAVKEENLERPRN